MIIVRRNVIKYLKKRWMYGSVCMYHSENSKIDQVTYSAMGIKMMEK